MLPNNQMTLAAGFTCLDDPRILHDIKYATADNFTGKPVPGYLESACIMTKATAEALIKVQNQLPQNYCLKIYDAYRPVDAVQAFLKWKLTPDIPALKNKYYPNLTKDELFNLGYISRNSNHSRGSAVDLTICKLDENSGNYITLEMGTIFDLFGKKGHTEYFTNKNNIFQENRLFLKKLMEDNGFKNFEKEWWHFDLINEPFPDQEFNFPIKSYK